MMIGELDDYIIDVKNHLDDSDLIWHASREPIYRIPFTPPKDPVIYFKNGSSIRAADCTQENIRSKMSDILYVAASEQSELEKFFEEYVKKKYGS